MSTDSITPLFRLSGKHAAPATSTFMEIFRMDKHSAGQIPNSIKTRTDGHKSEWFIKNPAQVPILVTLRFETVAGITPGDGKFQLVKG